MMTVPAIVLAAGFGSRLSPLTELHPKPVLPIAGVPMLSRILANLREAGAGRIAVNTHHLREQVERCIAESGFAESVTLFHEPEILGTSMRNPCFPPETAFCFITATLFMTSI